MTDAWRPRRPSRRENLVAGLVAAATGVAVGLTAFYLARVGMGRDRIRLEPPPLPRGGAGG